ncbi:MAG: response regulator [Rhodobacteraceae bacterium]|nr:response regulator [Paracoccaceae bacterium]
MSLRETLRVMVVDDMSTSRGLLLKALEEIGIRHVGFETTGLRAVTALESSPTHLVLSDFNMPELDGLGLLAQLRSRPSTRAIGFILVTGRADPATIEAGRRLGMNNVLLKPFGVPDLRNCIEAVVGRL